MVQREQALRSAEAADMAEHETRVGAFWVAVMLVVVCVCAGAPAGAPLRTGSGLPVLAGAVLFASLYVLRMRLGPPREARERLAVGNAGPLILAVLQWLVAPAPLLFVTLPLMVIGAMAIRERGQRASYVPFLLAAVASPLLYASPSATLVLGQVGFGLVLCLQMVLLTDYGNRLGTQRVALAEAEQEAQLRAVTDELTGLANRRALQDRLAAAGRGPTTVVYCDLDGFKPFNDQFGHAAGDALLRRIAAGLDAAVASHGAAFRVGGDEFCAVLDGDRRRPDDPVVAAIRSALAETGPGYAVECSHGVAVAPVDADDLPGALRVADERMYVAKAARGHGARRAALRAVADG